VIQNLNKVSSMSITSFFAPKKRHVDGEVSPKLALGARTGGGKSSEDGHDSSSSGRKKIKASDEADSADSTEKWPPLLSVKGTWATLLESEVKKAYFKKLTAFVDGEYASKTIFPPQDLIFNALMSCDFEDVRVVIIGQDPYHGPHQAHGLAFSVQKGVQIPPSLRNIYKEVENDLGHARPSHGNLEYWNGQGVLLLNTCLTVRKGEAFSHTKQGWEIFTDAIIRMVSLKSSGCVFLLWGKPAQLKGQLVNQSKHKIITTSHPSPLGAAKTDKPFLGSKCFSRCNAMLEQMGKPPIDWHIT